MSPELDDIIIGFVHSMFFLKARIFILFCCNGGIQKENSSSCKDAETGSSLGRLF